MDEVKRGIARQKHAGLDMDQGGGHHQKFPGDLEIQLFHEFQGRQILTGDIRDGDIVDIQLVLPDQVQQKVHRAFEDGQSDLIMRLMGHGGRHYIQYPV